MCDAGNGGEEEIVEVVQGRLDRPARETRLRLHAAEGAPHAHLHGPGQQRSRAVVTAPSQSGQVVDRGRSNVLEVTLAPEVVDQLVWVERKNRRPVVVIPPDGSDQGALLVANLLGGPPITSDARQPGTHLCVGCDSPEQRRRTEEVASRAPPLGCQGSVEWPEEAGRLPADRQGRQAWSR